MSEYLIKAKNLTKTYRIKKGILYAVKDVSLSIAPGETLAIVGESGSGKSTLGRLLLRLEEPTNGSLFFEGKDLLAIPPDEIKPLRQKMQMVFQDPYASLNPRMTIGDLIAEPFYIHNVGEKNKRVQEVEKLMGLVGLSPNLRDRFPHECSGGQRQRVGIARALALRPKLLICDEPISSLDVSIRAQILNLLKKIQQEMGVAILFIAHDLSIVKYIAHRVAVMYLGHIVEEGPVDSVFSSPLHPYTKALLSAVCVPDPVIEKQRKRLILQGEPPSPLSPPLGCPFSGRCPLAFEKCRQEKPALSKTGIHDAACFI